MAGQNELALIDWIRRRNALSPDLRVGIGDDAAVWQTHGQQLLFTTDVLMEDVDFRLSETAPQLIGRKSLAVNLSDIAAMAGRPLAALVGVALPKSRGIDFARELHTGIESLADEFDVAIIGGDTNIWDGPLVISMTLIGEATERGPVLRSGAKPGDALFVTGPLGGSLLGHHLSFMPRVREAQSLHQLVDLHAMIDLSDGLATDLSHVLIESGVGATLTADAIPISDAARLMSDTRTPLQHALTDGEDFELLFAVNERDSERLQSELNPIPVYRIGVVENTAGMRLKNSDGSIEEITQAGWEHKF